MRNLAALKMRLVKSVNRRLHPQPVHTFRREVHHCFRAGLYAANDVLTLAVAPVITRIKGIKNRSHAFSIVKGANQVVAIRVMKRVAKRNNIDPVVAV